MNNVWMVRAGERGIYYPIFTEKGIISIGWSELGNLSAVTDLETLTSKLKDTYDDYKNNNMKAGMNASQIFRFIKTLGINSIVMTYDAEKREYSIGKISSDYFFDDTIIKDYPHTKKVTWEKTVKRDDLTLNTKNSLGSIRTIFQISEDASDEIIKLLQPNHGDTQTEHQDVNYDNIEETESVFSQDQEAKSLEIIRDRLLKVSWDEAQDLVAGLFRAIGYKTRVSPPGPDKGKDIIASPDGYGFEYPRIKIEVKTQKDKISSDQMRSFIGGLRGDDKGMYVSFSGFSKDAQYEAERANHTISIMDSIDLVKEIVRYYDHFDNEARMILPLTKIYYPKN